MDKIGLTIEHSLILRSKHLGYSPNNGTFFGFQHRRADERRTGYLFRQWPQNAEELLVEQLAQCLEVTNTAGEQEGILYHMESVLGGLVRTHTCISYLHYALLCIGGCAAASGEENALWAWTISAVRTLPFVCGKPFVF